MSSLLVDCPPFWQPQLLLGIQWVLPGIGHWASAQPISAFSTSATGLSSCTPGRAVPNSTAHTIHSSLLWPGWYADGELRPLCYHREAIGGKSLWYTKDDKIQGVSENGARAAGLRTLWIPMNSGPLWGKFLRPGSSRGPEVLDDVTGLLIGYCFHIHRQ